MFWQEADLEQRSEIVGGVLADGLFVIYGGKVNVGLLRTGGKVLAPLSKYKPMALAKLGELGREINRATGLAYMRGKEYLRKGNQAIIAGEAGLISAVVTAIRNTSKDSIIGISERYGWKL